jgi:putative ABC transport system permease protein
MPAPVAGRPLGNPRVGSLTRPGGATRRVQAAGACGLLKRRRLLASGGEGPVHPSSDDHLSLIPGHRRPQTRDPRPPLDSTVFITLPIAERLFHQLPNPSEIYVRANQNNVISVSNLLGPTADPQDASGVQVSRPSDALEARAAAKGQFTTLLLGLGAVALLVGTIGIANIMVISVLERRAAIGLRRALGATRRHISTQFLTNRRARRPRRDRRAAIRPLATGVYAQTKTQPFIIPTWALIAAPTAAFAIGALAGLYPAIKAARISPTEALRT